ncbi:MAG: PEP-utilizing enzyme [Cyanobacteria bacterium]|nr:PEP-utilizing enzyme [Cyanobacteriota bacterium]
MKHSISLVILGLERGMRRLDGNQSLPSGMESHFGVPPSLQWILSAFAKFGHYDSTYIGGYHLEKIVESFPDLKVRFFRRWQECGEALALAEMLTPNNQDLVLVRAETLLLPDALAKLGIEAIQSSESLNIIAGFIDSKNNHDVNVLFIPRRQVSEVIQVAATLAKSRPKANLSELSQFLKEVKFVDLEGSASYIGDRERLSRLVFQGKARTLEQLSGLVQSAVVPKQLRFCVHDWFNGQASIVSNIRRFFPEGLIVIRSSTATEDSASYSGAGRFHSQLDIDVEDHQSIISGVECVIASYQRDGRTIDDRDEILVQEQIQGLRFSGVMLTRDPSSGAPYYVINFECDSGRSDVVTSGIAGKLRTVFQSWDTPVKHLEKEIAQIIALGTELRQLTYDDALDIEFGCSSSGTLYLFQVRPMTMLVARRGLFDKDLGGIRRAATEHFLERSQENPSLLGSSVLFANMSDWNPAEMIGTEPKPLSLSMYQLLVGNWAWAEARALIGYRDVGPEPLIHAFGGRPYVDVRASLNSFLPKNLDDKIGACWVENCMSRLAASPYLQDKIEFDITVTCLAFDWCDHADRMVEAGLSSIQITNFKQQLGELTQKIVSGAIHPIPDQMRLVEQLNVFRAECSRIDCLNLAASARRVQMLLDRCARWGIVPFAILARYGFIAMSLLRSLRDVGVFSDAEYDYILRAIPTVAGQLTKDLHAYAEGQKSLSEMIAEYGHLRPHSYDITSPSYADQPGMLLSGMPITPHHEVQWEEVEAMLSPRISDIARRLSDLELDITVAQLFTFLKTAIAGRERAKFEFMKTINDAIEAIAAFGNFLDLSRDDMSYVPVHEILRFAHDSLSGATSSRLRRIVAYRRKRQELTRALRLPDVIVNASNFDGFEQHEGKPNYVTRGKVVASVCLVEQFQPDLELAGKIVAIRAADPGFDWILGHAIAGLITEYGGVASHMAIRAAEFGLPAAIGCGSIIFESALRATRIELDCANERIQLL